MPYILNDESITCLHSLVCSYPCSVFQGGASIGAMRLAQTASYGVAPNAALPAVFVAQACELPMPHTASTELTPI